MKPTVSTFKNRASILTSGQPFYRLRPKEPGGMRVESRRGEKGPKKFRIKQFSPFFSLIKKVLRKDH